MTSARTSRPGIGEGPRDDAHDRDHQATIQILSRTRRPDNSRSMS